MSAKGNISHTGKWWQRILIIGFGLCVVAIGAQPLQVKHGGVLPFIKKHTTALAKEISLSSVGKEANTSPHLKTNTLANSKIEKSLNKTAPKVDRKYPDKLESSDRKELDDLIDNL